MATMTTTTTLPLLKIVDLTVRYRLRKRQTLATDQVSLEIPVSGYTLGIVGESGSGKTTLGMGIMNMIEKPGEIISGSVMFQGKEVLGRSDEVLRGYRWQQVAMVYQSAMNSLNPLTSALDHVVEVYLEHTQLSKSEARDLAVRLLSEVGIRPERVKSFPHEFSGGMRQRIVIAMALALRPKILIADEPTSALDVVVQKQILRLLKSEVEKNKLSLIFITHEIALLPGLVDNVVVMYKGQIVEQGPLEKVIYSPKHPYTEMLVNSLLSMDSTRKSLGNKTTEPDQFLALGASSCKFTSRCKYAFEKCRIVKPELLPTDTGDRFVACHKFN
jgi:peptide/nickel transport system ATP-binding protein